jgi:hypothetical protein
VDVMPPGRQIKCLHLSGGDGYVTMADGKTQYIRLFKPDRLTAQDPMGKGMLVANFAAPTIELQRATSSPDLPTWDVIRPDLFDPTACTSTASRSPRRCSTGCPSRASRSTRARP